MRRSDKRSQGIFEFICRYTDEQGFPPTLDEIGASEGFSSKSGVVRHLDKLEKWGWITRRHGHARGIRILRRRQRTPATLSVNGGIPFRRLVPRR